MENNLQARVDFFIETLSTLKKQYVWSVSDFTLRFIALTYTLNNKKFEKDEFDNTVKFIKKNAKWFSSYSGHQKFSTAALLITKFDDASQAFSYILECEDKMKAEGFKSTPNLSIASYAMLLTCEQKDLDNRVKRAMELYKKMKKKHFWLTGSDDYPIAVLLSESEEKIETLIDEMEENYEMLHRENFSKSNGLQFLSHILTFVPGTAKTKAQKTKNIYDCLKQNKLKVSATYYGMLGFLTLLGEYSEQAVEEVSEIVKYLKSKKDFKWIYKEMNILSAAALVSNQYLEKMSLSNELIETGIGISIETMIAAQTAAMIAATSAATSAAAASSS
jgi:hypothetical protein